MIIKYIDPMTHNIRITSFAELTVKTNPESGNDFIAVNMEYFDMYINIYANEDTIKSIVDDVFTTEKLDTTIYNDVSIGIEFKDVGQSEVSDFLDSIINVLDLADSEDLYDTDEEDDDYGEDEGTITYNDFL